MRLRAMLRLFLIFTLGIALGVTAIISGAQIAPTLTPGTSRDEVIRAHGWPPGRTSLGSREIWSYDAFRVVLEDGVVVEVSLQTKEKSAAPAAPPTSPSRKLPARSDAPPLRPSQLRPTYRSSPGGSGSVTQPPPANSATRAGPPSSVATRPVTSAEGEPKTPPRAPAAASGVPRPVWVITGGAILAALAAFAFRRKKRARRLQPGVRSTPASTPAPPVPASTTFEQHIASKLGPIVAGPPTAPVTPPPPAASVVDELAFDATLIRSLEWKRFELLVTLYYGATGVRAEGTGKGADGGVDIVLIQPTASRPHAYVQCKAWGSEPIGVSLIRELRGVMAADQIPQGVFATTSNYTPDARDFAHANAMTLLTTSDLVDHLAQLPESAQRSIFAAVTEGDYTTPSCPACERKMLWREKPQFWGCPQYPSCRSSPIYPRKART